ncbi:MAG: hypothetical protein ACXVW1_06665 [Nocardioides sp.]
MSDLRLLGPAAAVAVLALVGISACSHGGSGTPAPAKSPSPTPLSQVDTSGVVVQRDAFCSGIGPDDLEAALGSTAYHGDSYNNGDHARLVHGVRDVAHEFDCTWRLPDGTTARAWVFAPPVTPEQAGRLRDAEVTRGCSATKDAGFGHPSVATRCGPQGQPKGGWLQGYYGLFGDAWLSCTLSGPGTEPADGTSRTDAWCGAVLSAASGQTPEG